MMRSLLTGLTICCSLMAAHVDAGNLVFQRTSAEAHTRANVNANAAVDVNPTGGTSDEDHDDSTGQSPQCSSGATTQDGMQPNDYASFGAQASADFNPDGQVVSQLMTWAGMSQILNSVNYLVQSNGSSLGRGASELEIVDLTGGGGTFSVKATISISYAWGSVSGGPGIIEVDDPNSSFAAEVGIPGGGQLSIFGDLMSGSCMVFYPDDTWDSFNIYDDGATHTIDVEYTWANVLPSTSFNLSGSSTTGGTATVAGAQFARTSQTYTDVSLEIIQD